MAKPVPLLKPSSTADRVAAILRGRILRTAEDTYLGSEGDLAAEIGVSLPTLRQAARMLEYEQLLKIRPGKGGGYFSRRPNIETAIKSASQYLSSKDLVSNTMFMDCADSIVTKLLEGAVKCEDEILFKELRFFIEIQKRILKGRVVPEDSFKFSVELMTLFGEMSGNVLLDLFARILWNEVSVSHPPAVSFEETQQLMRANYRTRLDIAEAVLERNGEKALQAWEKRSKLLRSWPQQGFSLRRQQPHNSEPG